MEATRLAAEPASTRPANALHRLQAQAMNYAWGKSCEESEVRSRARAWPAEGHSPRCAGRRRPAAAGAPAHPATMLPCRSLSW
jgi:hypothetical protein